MQLERTAAPLRTRPWPISPTGAAGRECSGQALGGNASRWHFGIRFVMGGSARSSIAAECNPPCLHAGPAWRPVLIHNVGVSMKRLLAMAVFVFPLCASAADFCKRLPVDPEFPAGLGGSYELIGKDPLSGKGYTGTIVVGYGKNAYPLTRTINGSKVSGEAWIERCGPDKIMVLNARYDTKPAIKLACSPGTDGDNYYRITCKTRQAGSAKQGLEAWIQTP